MPVLRNVEGMNYVQIEQGLNELGEKVCIFRYINNCIFTFASELWQNNARAEILMCQVHELKGGCIGQASKLKHKCIILSQFLSIK